MKLFGLKNCDKCRSAAKTLDVSEIIDVREKQISEKILNEAFTNFGEKLVNQKSITWRRLSTTEQQKNPLELLKKYPTLMKRPLIRTKEGQLFLGWEDEVKAALTP